MGQVNLKSAVKDVVIIFHSLDGYQLFRLLLSRLFSISYYFVIKINLQKLNGYPFTRTPPGNLSLLTTDDLLNIKNNIQHLKQADRRDLLARIRFYEDGFHNCYGMKVDDKIAYIQWIVYPDENHIIQKFYRSRFNQINENQVLIENAFTFPEFRSKGYLPYVTRILLKKAHERGYTSAVGYIKFNNIVSLNEFLAMNFKISRVIRELKLLGFIFRNLK